MDIGDKIAVLRKQNNLTLEQVGNAVGVGKSTVRKWESGEIANMRRDKIAKLVSALHTSPAYLMGWTDDPSPKQKIEEVALPYVPMTKIPILGRVAAGIPLYAEQQIEGYTVTDLNHGADYYALRVKGDSMNALGIYEGDLVVVRHQDTVDDGDIAVVLVDHEDATIKKFHREGNVIQLIPCSTNPANVIQIYDAKKTDIAILGKVIRAQRDF